MYLVAVLGLSFGLASSANAQCHYPSPAPYQHNVGHPGGYGCQYPTQPIGPGLVNPHVPTYPTQPTYPVGGYNPYNPNIDINVNVNTIIGNNNVLNNLNLPR